MYLHPVITISLNFFFHLIRDKVPNGSPFLDGLTYMGSRNFQQGSLNDGYSGWSFRYRIAWAFIDQDLIIIQQLPVVFPSFNVLETITAHDNRKLSVWILFLQVGESVNGV